MSQRKKVNSPRGRDYSSKRKQPERKRKTPKKKSPDPSHCVQRRRRSNPKLPEEWTRSLMTPRKEAKSSRGRDSSSKRKRIIHRRTRPLISGEPLQLTPLTERKRKTPKKKSPDPSHCVQKRRRSNPKLPEEWVRSLMTPLEMKRRPVIEAKVDSHSDSMYDCVRVIDVQRPVLPVEFMEHLEKKYASPKKDKTDSKKGKGGKKTGGGKK